VLRNLRVAIKPGRSRIYGNNLWTNDGYSDAERGPLEAGHYVGGRDVAREKCSATVIEKMRDGSRGCREPETDNGQCCRAIRSRETSK